MRIVLDTNVLVSALISPHRSPAQVLRLLLQGDLFPLYDDRILTEYREVLRRAKFGFDPADVSAVLDGLRWSGSLVFAQPLAVELPDPDDLPFLEVAVAGRADAVVTGNVSHYRPRRGKHSVDILSPNELLDRLRHR